MAPGLVVFANDQLPSPVSPQRPLRVVVVHGDPNKVNPILPSGRWDDDDFESVRKARDALNSLGDSYSFTWLSNHDTLLEDIRKLKERGEIDLVLQFCDDGWMNHPRMEMHVTAYLEMLGIPFTGSGSKCIAMTYDKFAILKIAESINIPVPVCFYIENDEDIYKHTFSYPVILKPNSTDGSFGITAKSVCYNEAQLREAVAVIREEFQIDKRVSILVQEYLTGVDINVACLGYDAKGEPIVLPITEEDYSAVPEGLPKICGFESKWDESSPYYGITTRATTIPKETQEFVAQCSKRLFARLEIGDYARFDWRLDGNGNPKLLEANPNCGWCWDGHLAKTAATCGIDYAHVLQIIMHSALQRAQIAQQNKAKPVMFVNVGKAKAVTTSI